MTPLKADSLIEFKPWELVNQDRAQHKIDQSEAVGEKRKRKDGMGNSGIQRTQN